MDVNLDERWPDGLPDDVERAASLILDKIWDYATGVMHYKLSFVLAVIYHAYMRCAPIQCRRYQEAYVPARYRRRFRRHTREIACILGPVDHADMTARYIKSKEGMVGPRVTKRALLIMNAVFGSGMAMQPVVTAATAVYEAARACECRWKVAELAGAFGITNHSLSRCRTIWRNNAGKIGNAID